jgi:hypothetical protein
MSNLLQEALDAVRTINDSSYEILGLEDGFYNLDFSTDGYNYRITLNGLELWTDEYDNLRFNEETNSYDSLESHLRKRIQEIACTMLVISK